MNEKSPSSYHLSHSTIVYMQPLFIYANSNYHPCTHTFYIKAYLSIHCKIVFIHCIFCLFQETISTKRIRQQWWPRIMVSLMPHPLQNPTTTVQAAIIGSRPQQSTTTVGSKPKKQLETTIAAMPTTQEPVNLFMFDPIYRHSSIYAVNVGTHKKNGSKNRVN